MRRLYWRTVRVPTHLLLLVTAISVAGMWIVETLPRFRVTSYYNEMIEASELASLCMATLKEARLTKGLAIDYRYDPAQSGLIGVWMSPVTSVYGDLHAKQTSVNPNFAAVIVVALKEAGVKEGDPVALAFSGSFPALNVCVCAALKTLRVRPIAISSVAASQWGANCPEFLWIDMEALLCERGLVDCATVAASIGGVDDQGVGLSDSGQTFLRAAITREGLPFLASTTYDEAVRQRVALYRHHADRTEIAAYINVGGSTVSVGTPQDKRAFGVGLVQGLPANVPEKDSVLAYFAGSGVPVINLTQMRELARAYGLPWCPTTMPPIGQGGVYSRCRYSRAVAGGVLAVVLTAVSFTWYSQRTAVNGLFAEDPCDVGVEEKRER